MRNSIIAIVLLFSLFNIVGAARSQSFTGTFTGKEGERALTLKLKQETDGRVTGTFSDGESMLNVTGEVKDGVVSGKARLPGFPVNFFVKAKWDNGKVTLEITEEGQGGKPDSQTTEKIVLSLAGGTDAAPAMPATPSKPAPSSGTQGKGNPLDKSQAPADPFAGTYKTKDVTVVLRQGTAGHDGTITKDGTEYPLTAKRSGPGIEGSFKAGNDSFDFLSKVENGTMRLKTGDTVYLLIKEAAAGKSPAASPLEKPQTPKNPLAGGPKGAAPAAKEGPVQPAWKLLKHPSGVSVRYPRDWTVREVPGSGYQLLPPGANAESTDVYLINGQPTEGIARADDPRLAQALDGLIGQAAPALRRSKPGEAVKAEQEPGMLFTYDGGKNATARLYVTIINGYAIAVVGIGDIAKVESRDGVLRQIFASLGWKEGERDAGLVGAWTRVGETSLDARDSVGRLQASSVSNTQRTMILRPDGTCTSREVSRTIAIGQGVFLDSGDQVTTRNGRWFAGSGKLVLMWDKEAEEYTYKFGGGGGAKQIVIGTGGKRGEIWEAR